MDTKCKQPVSVNFSAQTVDEKESYKVLFAFFDSVLNEQDDQPSAEIQKVEKNPSAVTTDPKEL